jgi:hypothetical protein
MRASNFFGNIEQSSSVGLRKSKYGTNFGTTQMNATKKPETNLRKSIVDSPSDARKPVPKKRYSTITESGRDVFKIVGVKPEPKVKDNSNIHIQENWDDRDVEELMGKSFNGLDSGNRDFLEVRNKVNQGWKNKTGFGANGLRGGGFKGRRSGGVAGKLSTVVPKYIISNKPRVVGRKSLTSDDYCVEQQVFICGNRK